MFYSETILSRRGPLGRVWLAAHMERKLSKSQTLQTDIEQSVDVIMGKEIEVMALRLSGQLLLGVVRIYSRKAKYLLDDCNEALLKIKMAFRPGIVDLTEEQLTVNKTAITLQTNGLGLDLLLPDVDWDMDFEDRPLQRHGHHQAHIDDITLRPADNFQLGVDDPFDLGPSDGIGSQDFNDLDLGIHWGDEQIDKSVAMSAEESVEAGRDAQFHENSIDIDLAGNQDFNMDMDMLSHRSKSRDPSEQPFGHSMEIDAFQDVDLEDLGIGFGDEPPPLDPGGKDPYERRSLSRASSPLTEVPPTPPPVDDVPLVSEEVTEANNAIKLKKKPKDKKQIIDSITELQNANAAAKNRGRSGAHNNPLNTDIASITSTHHFLPRSSIVMRLQEIRSDPVAYFLSIQAKPNGAFVSCAPPGLTPELAQLFARPVSNAPMQKRKGTPLDDASHKKARLDEVEVPRRIASLAPDEENLDIPMSPRDIDASFEFPDQTTAMEDYQLDIPEFGQDMDNGRAKSVVSDKSRLSSLGPDATQETEHGDDSACPISVFGVTRSSQQSQSADLEQDQPDLQETDKQGYSKNTIKALTLIRNELQPSGGEDERVKPMSFQQMSNKASRRAAASFFFELLVLGTRDCIQVSQTAPFADITVLPKPRLWEQQTHSQEEQSL